MISLDNLLEEVWAKAQASKLPIETVGLSNALGRVVVEDIKSPIDVPQHDNSSMDGYAVRAHELTAGSALVVSDRIPADRKSVV